MHDELKARLMHQSSQPLIHVKSNIDTSSNKTGNNPALHSVIIMKLTLS